VFAYLEQKTRALTLYLYNGAVELDAVADVLNKILLADWSVHVTFTLMCGGGCVVTRPCYLYLNEQRNLLFVCENANQRYLI
jgi:hypothetical protein